MLQQAPVSPAPQDPPAWHWIPLGTVISLVALIPLAPAMLGVMRRILSRAYRPGLSAAEVAQVRAGAPVRVIALELAASAIPVLTLLLCVALGAYTLGRRGARTNRRHGALSGACTALLCGALAKSLLVTTALVPLAMLVGHFAARAGVQRRDRSAEHEPEDPAHRDH